jgi:hypothetical protein
MMYMNEVQSSQFDYLFNNQKFINNDFFGKEKEFSLNGKNEEQKLDMMVDYLKYVFGVITPKNLKIFFENSIL